MLVQAAVLSVHVKVQAVSLNHKVLLDSNTEQHKYSKDSSRVNMTHTQIHKHACTLAHTEHIHTQIHRHARTHAHTEHIHKYTCMHAHTLNANNTHMLAIFLVSCVILSICSLSSVSLLR